MNTSTSVDMISSSNAILNGGFETGNFTNWSTIGTAFVDKSDFGIFPPEGTYSALLITGAAEDGELNVFSDSDIESFLGLKSGTLDALIEKNGIEGSAILQTFTAKAGDTLSFDWNFLTNEASDTEIFNDFAFITINGEVFKLADTFSSLFSSSANEFDSETGFQAFSYTVSTDGIFTLGFGVLDAGDTMMSSGLSIDNVKLVSTSVL
ncbi:MAG: hypothetical protein SAL70_12910 [Scytonema sp. PMC 1070.18]|nr:hypothetical protein [Scytonema sp. PMC 1070.18]